MNEILKNLSVGYKNIYETNNYIDPWELRDKLSKILKDCKVTVYSKRKSCTEDDWMFVCKKNTKHCCEWRKYRDWSCDNNSESYNTWIYTILIYQKLKEFEVVVWDINGNRHDVSTYAKSKQKAKSNAFAYVSEIVFGEHVALSHTEYEFNYETKETGLYKWVINN